MTLKITRDDFLGGALRLRQPESGYRAGLDAVLLAAACPALSGQRVLDCGAGVGTVGLAVARRIGGARVTLVERDAVLANLAQENVRDNGLADRCTVIAADLTAKLSGLGDLAAHAGRFDHTLANPPYFSQARGTRASDQLKDGSHAMPDGALEDWVRFAAAMTCEGGTLTLVHRVEALSEMLAAMDRRFGGVVILPLHPRSAEPANRVLVQGTKASRAPLTLLAGRTLHVDGAHAFTPEFDAILRHGAELQIR